jgi:hypothetical protein
MNIALAQGQLNLLQYDQRENISDGYHTFKELYDHRIALWMVVLSKYKDDPQAKIYNRLKHNHGSFFDGYFLSLLVIDSNIQISYHLPLKFWQKVAGQKFDRSPIEYDGHTAQNCVDRLMGLIDYK